MRCGLSKGWFKSGYPEFEEQWSQGLLHGERREWHEGGRLAAEDLFEYGTCLWRKRWDEDRAPVDGFRLEETDPNFHVLQLYRAAFKEAGLNLSARRNRTM